MQFVIVTGLSGAGRTTALRRLEDLDYFCVDNLMPKFIPEFAASCLAADEPVTKAAVAVDTRMGDWFLSVYDTINTLREMPDIKLNILFLDASDETIIRRFKSTRRPHPMSKSGDITDGIHAERHCLQRIKDMATRVIDTSSYSLIRLYRTIDSYYKENRENEMLISVLSFGYKRGIPLDADMVFDVRFLPNPFYEDSLRNLTGQSSEVKDFVLSSEGAAEFTDRLTEMTEAIIPMFLQQDKRHLVIGIGCTGGMHRSVAIAEEIYRKLSEKKYNVHLEHRDMRLETSQVD